MCASPCVVIVPLLQEGIGEVTYGLIFADYLAVHGGGKPFLVTFPFTAPYSKVPDCVQ